MEWNVNKVNGRLLGKLEGADARVEEISSRFASSGRPLQLEFNNAAARAEVLASLVHREILCSKEELLSELDRMLLIGPYALPRHELFDEQIYVRERITFIVGLKDELAAA